MGSAHYPAGVTDAHEHFNLQSVGDPPEVIMTTIPCPNTSCDRGWVQYDGERQMSPCPTCERAGEIEIEVCTACGGREWECKCS